MELKRRATVSDEYVNIMCSQPSFKACDALSDTVTDSTTGGDDDASDGCFETFDSKEWSVALSKTVPSITEGSKDRDQGFRAPWCRGRKS